MPRKRTPVRQRWATKVSIGDDCWEWTGAKTAYGYGLIREAGCGRIVPAHRLSYEMFVGPVSRSLDVLHRCDHPWCVKPSHLFLGTQTDNNADRDAKGRNGLVPMYGEEHPLAKLTDRGVVRMRALYETGLISQPELARVFNVRQSTISSILLGKTWRDLS